MMLNKNEIALPAQDHRTRVGIMRREKTRALLMKSALEVFAEKGPDAPVIDDFIAAAGVARGTFYNYFRTTSDLLLALCGEMSDEALAVVDAEVRKLDDPAARLCTGARLYVRTACKYPLWGTFLARVGSRHTVRGKLLDQYLCRDIALGVGARRFKITNEVVVRDIMLGSIFFGIETLLTEKNQDNHVEDMMHLVLIGLGLRKQEAHDIAYMPLPDTGPVVGPIFQTLSLSAGLHMQPPPQN